MQTAKGSNAYQREELEVEENRDQHYRRETIDVLPDDVLLDVFNFYLDGDTSPQALDAWHKLVHVCRKWRQLVFASPRRLNLRLLCTSRRPVQMLDVWPALPIVIEDYQSSWGHWHIINIGTALDHNDRVCKIGLYEPSLFLDSMTKPFPALTCLKILSYSEMAPVLPASLLGGTAPRLHALFLERVPFPGLPMLLLSAHHLVHLSLHGIPDSGFISPKAMVTCLSFLTNLKKLLLDFQLFRSHPHSIRPPLTRAVLPSLTFLFFSGASEYLEYIISRIDFPLLNHTRITLLDDVIFDIPLLRSLIHRTEAFKAFNLAEILFSYNLAAVTLVREGGDHNGVLQLGVACEPFDPQLSSMAQICNLCLPPLPTLEHLNICEYQDGPYWQGDMEDTLWLELLRRFITVKGLYLDKGVTPRVARALQELTGERVTEVLPALQNVFVQGPVEQGIGQFVAARQLLGHPAIVQDWDGKRHSKAWDELDSIYELF